MKHVLPPVLSSFSSSCKETELYVASVSVTGGPAGHGRMSGHVRSDGGELDLRLSLPPELGGNGGGTNPEQLFAAAYAACFHGSLIVLASRRGVDADSARVEVSVRLSGDPVDGLFMLAADVHIHMPDVPRPVAAELVRNAERLCPYTKMARHGIPGIVTLIELEA